MLASAKRDEAGRFVIPSDEIRRIARAARSPRVASSTGRRG